MGGDQSRRGNRDGACRDREAPRRLMATSADASPFLDPRPLMGLYPGLREISQLNNEFFTLKHAPISSVRRRRLKGKETWSHSRGNQSDLRFIPDYIFRRSLGSLRLEEIGPRLNTKSKFIQ